MKEKSAPPYPIDIHSAYTIYLAIKVLSESQDAFMGNDHLSTTNLE